MKIKPEDLKNYIGKKIRCDVGFNEDNYIVLLAIGDDQLFAKTMSNRETTWSINQGAWETYEEPKKKVKMWLWIYKTNAKHQEKYTYITSRFYKSEQDAKEAHLGDIVIQRADWTEIEVEE